MEKPKKVKIIQILRAQNEHMNFTLGLGNDNNVYIWQDKGGWNLYTYLPAK